MTGAVWFRIVITVRRVIPFNLNYAFVPRLARQRKEPLLLLRRRG